MSDFWYSVEEDLEETRKCLKETQQELQRKDNIINGIKKWLEDYIKLFDSPDILEE